MSCDRIEGSLIAYLEGRAGEKESTEVEVHLAGCAACRARAEEFRRLWSLLDDLPRLEVSPAFDARLRQRLADQPRPGIWSWLLPQPRLALAVMLLLALSSWIASRPATVQPVSWPLAHTEEDFGMIKDLRVLENYDVLANFEALSELQPGPPAQQAESN